MKFGKGLLREILQSNPEWAPFWLNYKNLKKRIKAVTQAAHHAASQRDICTCVALSAIEDRCLWCTS
jgi:SPX domain protein involved in polyphosphate accumulation